MRSEGVGSVCYWSARGNPEIANNIFVVQLWRSVKYGCLAKII